MKKKYLFILLLVLPFQFVWAQPGRFIGTWEGKLNVGIELRIVFHIKEQTDGSFKSTADSPDQSAYGLKCDTTILSGNELTIQMLDLGASYTGKMIDDSTMDGLFTQGSEFPLALKKVWLTPVSRVLMVGVGLVGLILPMLIYLEVRPFVSDLLRLELGYGPGFWLNGVGHTPVVLLAAWQLAKK